jgi:hypothetical protein
MVECQVKCLAGLGVPDEECADKDACVEDVPCFSLHLGFSSGFSE